MIFVDTWAWLALAVKRDQYHAVDAGHYILVPVSSDQFRQAGQMRRKFHDKPDISFVDR